MTTATANDLTVPLIGGHHHFLLRRLHSLTGIIFGGYLIVHLIVNASLVQGFAKRDIFQTQVDKIHSLPFLLGVEWVFIFLPILYHALYGLWITFTAKWNIGRYPYEKNWFYVLQRISALILIAFILFHILAMKGLLGKGLAFDPEHATSSIAMHINSSWAVAYLVYPIGILASAYHTSNGLWTAAITWGLTTSSQSQRRWGWVCGCVCLLLLACGTLALIGAITDASHLANSFPRQP